MDYLRSMKLNYSYSIIMRERNMISDEIQSKQQLLSIFGLSDLYNASERFDISVLEMLLIKYSQFLSTQKETAEQGVQIELISKDKTVNTQLLNEIRIAEARKLVE